MTDQRQRPLEEVALSPLTRASRPYWAFVGLLAVVVAWGLYAYVTQVRTGLAVTGMRDKIL
jgi:hypothetical protein